MPLLLGCPTTTATTMEAIASLTPQIIMESLQIISKSVAVRVVTMIHLPEGRGRVENLVTEMTDPPTPMAMETKINLIYPTTNNSPKKNDDVSSKKLKWYLAKKVSLAG